MVLKIDLLKRASGGFESVRLQRGCGRERVGRAAVGREHQVFSAAIDGRFGRLVQSKGREDVVGRLRR